MSNGYSRDTLTITFSNHGMHFLFVVPLATSPVSGLFLLFSDTHAYVAKAFYQVSVRSKMLRTAVKSLTDLVELVRIH